MIAENDILFPDSFYPYHQINFIFFFIVLQLGAGKTNVALLTIIHEIRKNMEEQGVLRREELKVIYVAPMKALAQEIVEKFKERLSKLGLIVRELTGKKNE